MATPIVDFSGRIPNWHLIGDPGSGSSYFDLGNADSLDLSGLYSGAGSLSFTFGGPVEIDTGSRGYTDLGFSGTTHFSQSTFDFVDPSVSFTIDDGLGNDVTFEIRLDSLIIQDTFNFSTLRGSSTAFINAEAFYLGNETLSFVEAGALLGLDFADTWGTGDDFVLSLQVTGLVPLQQQGFGTLSDYIVNNESILDGNLTSGSYSAKTVPEPSSMLLLGAGVAAMAGVRRRRKR